jgi:hypothetical protein
MRRPLYDASLVRGVLCTTPPLYHMPCLPCTTRPLSKAPIVQCVPCMVCPSYDASLVQCVPCTVQCVPWMMVPQASLRQCVPSGTDDLFFPLLFTASLIFRDISSGFFSIAFILCCTSHLSGEFLF